MFLLQIVALQDLVDFFHAIGNRNLVREIRREHERFGADPFDGISQRFLIALAADENPVVGKIVAGMTLELESAVFELPLEAIPMQERPQGPRSRLLARPR